MRNRDMKPAGYDTWLDTNSSTAKRRAFREGFNARQRGDKAESNPYNTFNLAESWFDGWVDCDNVRRDAIANQMEGCA